MSALLLLADGRFPAGGHAHSAGVEAAVADGRVADIASLAAFAEGRLRTVGLVDAAVAMATATRFVDLAAALAGDDRGIDVDEPAEGAGHDAETETAAVPRPPQECPLLGPRGPGSGHTWRSAIGPLEAAAASRALLARLDAEVDARTPAPPLRAASRRLGRQLLRTAALCWPSPLLTLALEGEPDAHQAVAFGLAGVAAGMSVEHVGDLVVHHALTTPMQAGVRLLGLDPFAVAAATAGLADVAASVVAEALPFAAGPLEALPARSATLVDLAAVGHAAADGRLFVT